jgi:hypothetical protein
MKPLLKSAAYAGLVSPRSQDCRRRQQQAGSMQAKAKASSRNSVRTPRLTYWVDGPDGWDVVTTVDPLAGSEDDIDGRSVIRFSSRLLPGQSQTISVPAAVGAEQPSLVIRRIADCRPHQSGYGALAVGLRALQRTRRPSPTARRRWPSRP